MAKGEEPGVIKMRLDGPRSFACLAFEGIVRTRVGASTPTNQVGKPLLSGVGMAMFFELAE